MSAIEKARTTASQQRIGPLVGMKFSSPGPVKKAMTLKLDELGRPVDEDGNVIGLPNKEVISSLKVNQRMNKGKLKIEKPVMETDPERVCYFSLFLNTRLADKLSPSPLLPFIEPLL